MKILVVDDEKSLRVALTDELREEGITVFSAASGEEAIEILMREDFDLVITDLKMGEVGGIEILSYIKQHDCPAEVVLITGYGTVESAVEAMKYGALDYLCKPFEMEALHHLIRTARETIRLKRENEELKVKLFERHQFHNIVGKSKAMQTVFETIEIVGESDSVVLIVGETGTGKELVAEAIHYKGKRRKGPFIAVNCASLSGEVIESELFGHEKGAFTGALKERKGRCELADGGTLFLDDIDDTPLETQVKVLRFVQSGKFERVGGEQTISADVRIIASTKNDLLTMVEKGRFRKDLYYRLNVIQVPLPPLRERKEDIPLLVDHFLKKFAPDRPLELSAEILELFLNYDWDGNVRELEHTVERLVLLARDGLVTKEAVPVKIIDFRHDQVPFRPGEISLPDYLDRLERQVLVDVLQKAGGNRQKTAEMLNIPLPTLKSKLKKYQL